MCRRIGDGTQRREWLRVPAPPKGMHANGPASRGEIAGQSPARGLGPQHSVDEPAQTGAVLAAAELRAPVRSSSASWVTASSRDATKVR